jgi:hypothetical protein
MLTRQISPTFSSTQQQRLTISQLLNSLVQRRDVWGTPSLAEYLAAAEQKYTAESKVADLMTLQQFLRDRIAVETALIANFGSADPPAASQGGSDDRDIARNSLLRAILQEETVVKRIKAKFQAANLKLPPERRFAPPKGGEIRQKLRELNGAPAAVAAGVALPTPENWHSRKASLQLLVDKRNKLLAKLEEARGILMRMRREGAEDEMLDDTTLSMLSADIAPSTDVTPANFDA